MMWLFLGCALAARQWERVWQRAATGSAPLRATERGIPGVGSASARSDEDGIEGTGRTRHMTSVPIARWPVSG